MTRPAFEPIARAAIAAATDIFGSEGYRGGTRARLTEMWANVSEPGGWHTPHIHTGALWSGVFYVSVPDGAPDIVFMDPRGVGPHQRSALYGAEPEGDRVSPPVQPGLMLFFPQWLPHYVVPHPSAEPRISVSFNIDQIVPEGPKTPSFVSVPEVLSRDEITRVYAQLAGVKWGAGLVDGGRKSAMRANSVFFVPDGAREDSPWHWLYRKVRDLAEIVNAEAFGFDISADAEIQFARYATGEKYDEHIDRAGAMSRAGTRTLSCSIFLRQAGKGGGIRFPRADEQPPHTAPGDAVFFPGTEPHAALPVEEGTRDALVFWFHEAAGGKDDAA